MSVSQVGTGQPALNRDNTANGTVALPCPGSKEVGRHPHSTESRVDHRPGHVDDEKPAPLQAISWTRFMKGILYR